MGTTSRLTHKFVASQLLALTLGACQSGRAPADELVVLIETPPATLDPRFAVSAYDFKLARLVHAPLVSVDDQELEPRMELAESVEVRSPTEYIVTLRADARFSDGRPVRADDVVYTFRSAEQAGSRLRLRFRDAGLRAIEPLDARHLRFVLDHPHGPFLTDLDVGILARPPAGRERDAPVGAGPFVFESNAHDRWSFRPNSHYFRGAPAIRRLIVQVIRDDNSRLLALVGGSADLTQNSVPPLLLDAVARQPRLRVAHGRSSVLSYLGFNCDDPVTGDPRVRRAIAHALDRDRIIATKLGGRAVSATGMLPTFHWAYSRDVERYPYDPTRARRLLDEAGYRDPDGDGPRPRFTLVYKTSSNRFRVALAQVIAAQLAEVGIGVDLRPLEFSTFFADVKAGNFQLFSMQIPEIAEPDLYTNFFHSSRIPTRENPDVGGNRARYHNAELDRWIDRGRLETERSRRVAVYREVQRILAHDLPVLSLWHEDNVVVMGDRVRGFELLPTAQLSSLATTTKR